MEGEGGSSRRDEERREEDEGRFGFGTSSNAATDTKPKPTGNVRGFADLVDQASSEEDVEWFTGGEKSGMMVQDPTRKKGEIVEDLFKKAKEHGAQQGNPEDLLTSAELPYRAFTGAGRTLSGEVRPGTSAQDEMRGTPRVHTITFWGNGFTVDDGNLRRFDDDTSLPFLRSISKGECPRELEPADRSIAVTVNLVRRDHEEWKPKPVPKYQAFAGSGRTLGSSNATAPSPEATDVEKSGHTNVDDSKPSTSIQIRLADGTRMVSRFNLDQTVMDIRKFIDLSCPGPPPAYTLMNANEFPPKPLNDLHQTIESANLANAVVNQRL